MIITKLRQTALKKEGRKNDKFKPARNKSKTVNV